MNPDDMEGFFSASDGSNLDHAVWYSFSAFQAYYRKR